MSFIHPIRASKSSKNAYLITLTAVLIAYLFIGQIPLAVAVSIAENSSPEPLKLLQNSYGLTTTFCLVIFPLVSVFFTLLLCFRYVHGWKLHTVFNSTGKIRYSRILISFLVWGTLSGIILAIGWNSHIISNFDSSKFFPLLIIAIVVIPIQCAAEEMLFRSYIFQWLGVSINKVWVIVLAGGLLFGLLHGANPEIGELGNIALVYYIWSGIFLGLITVFDDGIELSLGYHIANNLFATIIVTTEWQAFQTDAILVDTNAPSFTFETMLLLIVAQFLFVLVFHRHNFKGLLAKLK